MTSTNTTIAILGANGRVSHAVAKAFHAAGYRVIAVTRSGTADGLPEGIEQRAGDAEDLSSLIEATRGADIIFNGLNSPYTQWKDKALPMADNVIAAAKAHGATQLFIGNVYNYGVEIPATVDEEAPFSGSTGKGAIRIAMEQRFAHAARKERVQTLTIRAGDFYGTDKTGSWFDLVIASKLAKGVFTYPGRIDINHAWAYLPDLARAFVLLAEKRGELGNFETFTFEGHTMTGQNLLGHAEAATGRKLRRAGMPWIVLRAAGVFNAMWREITEMSYLWFAPHRLSSRKLEALVGPLPRTKPAEAVRQALADLGYEVAGVKKGEAA